VVRKGDNEKREERVKGNTIKGRERGEKDMERWKEGREVRKIKFRRGKRWGGETVVETREKSETDREIERGRGRWGGERGKEGKEVRSTEAWTERREVRRRW
jgi:hypothetical protein